MSDAAPTPPVAPTPSMSEAASGLTQTSSIRLAPGAIPSSWTKPAEAATTPPTPQRRPVATGLLVGAGVLACVAVAVAIAPGSKWTPKPAAHAHATPTTPAAPATPPAAPVTTTPDGAKSIADVPTPAPPKPGVAPEDETGDDVKPKVADPPVVNPPAPAAAASTTPPPVSTSEVVGGELPNRKKAKLLTQKAIAMLRDGNYGEAEPVLVRSVLVDPSYAEGWRHLGIARAQLGDRDGARRAYKKYLALAPNAPDAADVKKILGAN